MRRWELDLNFTPKEALIELDNYAFGCNIKRYEPEYLQEYLSKKCFCGRSLRIRDGLHNVAALISIILNGQEMTARDALRRISPDFDDSDILCE